jgi:hypothetical protein
VSSPDFIETVIKQARRVAPLQLVGPAAQSAEQDELGVLVDCVLSRYIAGGSRHYPPDSHTLSRMLARCAHAHAFVGTTRLSPIDPTVALHGLRAGKTALRRLSMNQADIRERFEQLDDAMGPLARFGPDILEAFGLLPLRHVVVAMIIDGPGITAQRGERALRAVARSDVPATTRRAAGAPSKTTIVRRRNELRRIMRVIVTMRQLGHPCAHLERWLARSSRWGVGGIACRCLVLAVLWVDEW